MIITKFEIFLESQKNLEFDSKIPSSIKDIQKLFTLHGKKLYVVGGAVRDFLTGKEPKDYDLCTDAKPDQIERILSGKYKYEGGRGKSFGVVVVFTDDQPEGMEIATFRKDITQGRKPKVDFDATIEDDVNRRDLTFNALFYDIEKCEIVDLVGGLEDLESGTIRMVGDPKERMDEDPLRILRAFRFAARYKQPLHPTLIKAIRERNHLKSINHETGVVERISGERIWGEMKKCFQQCESPKDFSSFLHLINDCNMWEEAFPDAVINKEIIPTNSLEIYMANLFKDEKVKNLASRLNERYKIEFDMANIIEFLVDLQNLNVDNILSMNKKMGRCKVTKPLMFEWLKLRNLDDKIFKIFPSYEPITNPKDLMSKGFKGPSLGKEIERVESERVKKMIGS